MMRQADRSSSKLFCFAFALAASAACALFSETACAQELAADAPYTGPDAVTVRVLIWNRNGERPLLETPAPNTTWRPVCAAPCNLAVDPKLIYRINGEAFRRLGYVPHQGWVTGEESVDPSPPFRFSAGQPRVDLNVHSALSDHFEMAGFSTLFAALLLGSGIPVLAAEQKSKGLRYGYGIPATVLGAVFAAGAVIFFADHTWVTDLRGNKIARNRIDLGKGLSLDPNGLVF